MNNLKELETGLYVFWAGKSQVYKRNKTSIYQIFHGDGDSELVSHVKALIPFGANETNLYFFDEYFYVVVLKDDELKSKFIETWKRIYKETILSQPTDRHDNILKGACESLIISLVCDICGVKVIDNEPMIKKLISSVIHAPVITTKPRSIL